MEFALATRHIWRHRIWLVPVVVAAAIAMLAVAYRVSVVPPALGSRSLAYGSASSQILIQPSQPGALAKVTATDIVTTQQASIYAALLRSQPVRRQIGRNAHLPWQSIAVEGNTNPSSEAEGASRETNSSQRSAELVARGRAFEVFFNMQPEVPIINLYAEASTARVAQKLVTAAGNGLASYVAMLQKRNGTEPWQRVELVKLGLPEAGTVGSGANWALAVVAGFLVFGIGCLLIVLIPRFLLALRQADAIAAGIRPEGTVTSLPTQRHIEENGSGPRVDPAPLIDRP